MHSGAWEFGLSMLKAGFHAISDCDGLGNYGSRLLGKILNHALAGGLLGSFGWVLSHTGKEVSRNFKLAYTKYKVITLLHMLDSV